MTPEAVLTRLTELVHELAPVKDVPITSTTDLEHDLGMDSLLRVDLVTNVEAAFDIEIPDGDLAGIAEIKDLVAAVMAA